MNSPINSRMKVRQNYRLLSLFFSIMNLCFQIGCTLNANVTDLDSKSLISSDQINTPTIPIDSTSPPTNPAIPNTTPTPLKLTGNSSKSSNPGLRVFTELTAGWQITGDCETDDGTVTISGDINSSFTTACLNDQFSVFINHNTTSPYFNSAPGIGKRIKISQNISSEETILYKTLSSSPPPTVITTKPGLVAIDSDLTKDYILGSDIDISNGGANPVNNFFPLAFNNVNGFKGTLEGDGHTISNLNITSGNWSACLFDMVGNNGTIRNLNLTNVNLSTDIFAFASTQMGSIICTSYGTNILVEKVSVKGLITSNDVDTAVGGVIGRAFYDVTLNDIKSEMTISGTGFYAGSIAGSASTISMQRVYSNSNISMITKPNYPIGGLIGLMGASASSIIKDSYFTGTLTNAEVAGGLIGKLLTSNNHSIINSYSLANITVAASKKGGPIIGDPDGFSYTLQSTYYLNTLTCTNCTNSIGTSKTDANLKALATFTSWDFLAVWKIVEGISYPTLLEN